MRNQNGRPGPVWKGGASCAAGGDNNTRVKRRGSLDGPGSNSVFERKERVTDVAMVAPLLRNITPPSLEQKTDSIHDK